MKKSSFVALVLGTVSGVLFALGMCMVLIPEWYAARPGTVFGVLGLALALVTLAVWRRMEHKAPIRVSGKMVLCVLVGIAGALGLGIGMCFSMLWGKMAVGIVLGLAGIAALIALIPLTKGLGD